VDAFRHAQDAKQYEGADVSAPLEAAVACAKCRNCHCAALLPRYAWGPRIKPRPEDDRPWPANFCPDDDAN
jgi:hypothetical protein